ncbi:MAG: hypothetical protein MJZ15_05230 [Bacteroidales bacterium]|nr:hypothetical protein [Bacteroidales bacterium]
MKNIIHIGIAFVASVFCGCRVLDSECRDLMGQYISSVDEHLNEDIPCDIHLNLNESFDAFSFSNNVELNVTFYLDEAFEFPNLTLNYDMSVDGNWDYSDSLLCVSVDTTTFCCNYIGSSAKSATEESMARQIRKNIIAGELMPKIRKQVIDSSVRSVRVYAITSDSLVVEHPISHCQHIMYRLK